ncbi:MAG: hypothetical protein K5650_05550 [Bacteroidales bacterium]|nr:hypothetical protein [Bacteroidales bacterium]
MKTGKKIFLPLLIGLVQLVWLPVGQAQIKLSVDTLECPIVGFGVGLVAPSGGNSYAFALDGSKSADGTMATLYDAPYLDFTINSAFKFASNWLITLDGDLWFGLSGDNLTHRKERMGDIFSGEVLLGFGGYDGVVTCYNRALMARIGVGNIQPIIKGNPNSGIMLRLTGGPIWQRTVFAQNLNESPVPQLNERYRRIYDHYRSGIILTEGIGLWFMSNYLNLINFSVELQVSQCLTWPVRAYTLDNYLGLNGKDEHTYLDFLFGLKFTWMFPLKGKTSYDYYLF